MSFATILDNIAMSRSAVVRGFASLLTPKTDAELDALADRARELTLQHFGRTMRLFAPLYLSNECINSCRYCGFSRENPILRVTLSVDEVVKEARHLSAAGFRQLLLVAGEHPKFVGRDYLAECVRALRDDYSSISIEVAPMETEEYIPIVEAGAEGLVVYQETYNRAIYDQLHLAGPKKDFGWRLACPERGYDAGFRRLGIGALFGLAPWREEAISPRGPSRIFAQTLLEIFPHCKCPAPSSGGRRISPAVSHERSRSRSSGVRPARYLSAGRDRPEHA